MAVQSQDRDGVYLIDVHKSTLEGLVLQLALGLLE